MSLCGFRAGPPLGLACAALILIGLLFLARGLAIPVKAVVAQQMLDRAFEAGLAARAPVKPWPWADTAPVARLTVPRLGVTEVVLDGGSGEAMAFGPTLLPAGARAAAEGTSLMAGHRDTHFAFLGKLRPGDAIIVQSIDGTTRRYRLAHTQVVRWDGFHFRRHPPVPMLALVTCYPLGATQRGPLRLVAWATAA